MTAPLDLDALERAALEAEQFEIQIIDNDEVVIRSRSGGVLRLCWHGGGGVEHIAFKLACAYTNPATVLELIRRLRSAEADAGRYRKIRSLPTIGRIHVLDAADHEYDELWEEVRGEALDALVDAEK